jgi:cathepsin D
VTMGGYSVASQTFATCSTISSGLINSGVSGIMGLSWQALAYSGATPWWITLAQSSSWSSPLFGFHLARWRDVSGATSSESDGGTATFGYLGESSRPRWPRVMVMSCRRPHADVADSSLYSGSITYVSVSSGASYWQIPMDSMTMQGSTISLGGSTTVAIDTGTTLIGGPSSIIAAIYAAIPGSEQMTGSYQLCHHLWRLHHPNHRRGLQSREVFLRHDDVYRRGVHPGSLVRFASPVSVHSSTPMYIPLYLAPVVFG